MKADDIKRMTVLSIENGAKLGTVDDVVFDTRGMRVAALCIKADQQRATVPFDQIRSIGADAVTVPTDAVAHWGGASTALGNLPNLDALRELKVVDEAGTLLGKVRQVDIAPEDGRITRLEVHKGGILGMGGDTELIDAGEVTSVGDEVMVVSSHRRRGPP